MFSRRKLVVGRKTGSLLLAAALISASDPQMLGNPELISSKTGRLGDCAIAGIKFFSRIVEGQCLLLVR